MIACSRGLLFEFVEVLYEVVLFLLHEVLNKVFDVDGYNNIVVLDTGNYCRLVYSDISVLVLSK